VGTVTEVGDGIARIRGLQNAMASEILEFSTGTLGIALNLDEDTVGAIIMGEYSGIQEGDIVRSTGRIASVPVGDAMVGRVVNALGQPIDGKGPIETDAFRPVERIAPNVEKRILELRDRYERLIVVYGDCGTYGALDAILEKYGIQRIAGPHCYEMYAGKRFEQLMEEEAGTYFLTDFLVRKFQGTIIRGMGLDRFPELKHDYFRNYTRLVYLAQNGDLQLREQAQEIADYLELPLEIHHTGYGLLEERLVELMQDRNKK
jgi:hypothetical protein